MWHAVRSACHTLAATDRHRQRISIRTCEPIESLQCTRNRAAFYLNLDSLFRHYVALKSVRPHIARLYESLILELTSVLRNGKPTLAGIMLFSTYPQAFFPQLSIIATRIPGTQIGDTRPNEERFIDNARIEGPLDEQLRGAIAFIRKNIRTTTIISPENGERMDAAEYPIEAVRELILNALIHRDYSIHSQGMPIQLQSLDDRMTIINPGSLYGRLTIDQLGTIQPDTRNPVIANALEVLRVTKNRYSGITTVRRLDSETGMDAPLFENTRGEFRATMYSPLARTTLPSVMSHEAFNRLDYQANGQRPNSRRRIRPEERNAAILQFCATPRARRQIANFIGLDSTAYAMRTYVQPLVVPGQLVLGLPDKPQSSNQTYRTA